MYLDHENAYMLDEDEGINVKDHENAFEVIDDDGASYKIDTGKSAVSNSKKSKSMNGQANSQPISQMGEVKIYPMIGDKGPEVRTLQNLLIKNGFKLPKYGPDGDFGNETQTAVINAQEKFGLKPNGIVTEQLMSKLRGQTSNTPTRKTTTSAPNYRTTASSSKGLFSKLTPVHYVGGAALLGIGIIYMMKKKK